MVGFTNPVPLVTAFVALLPAGVLFFYAYGRYDGLFQDNVVFLFFMGGLIAGAFLSLFAIYMTIASVLLLVTLVPLLYGILPTAMLNRRKWQGERHSIFNGGALGLGVASTTSFAFVFRGLSSGLTWGTAAEWALVAVGLAGQQFAAGLLLGLGVSERKPFQGAFVAAALTAVYFVVLYEYLRSGLVFWPLVGLALGLLAFLGAYARVMPKAVEPGARRRRRLRRASS